MIKNECEHEWIRHTNIKADGNGPYYICEKCKVIMQASEVIQFKSPVRLKKELEILGVF